MPANNLPMYVRRASNSSTGGNTKTFSDIITLAANDFTGAGANNVLVATIDATNGSFLVGFTVKATGTNVATVARMFLNNGSTNATAINNALISEMSLPATTASATTNTSADIFWPIGKPLEPGTRIYIGLATAVASGWQFVPVYGDF
jgi:hypothetical protein